ncbi:MAG: prolipoprotein diacylglyceryl transferase family protein [Microgenomates group bacterium]
MLPVLVNLGPIKIYTFGVFLMLAFFWGSFLLWKNIRLTSFSEEDIFDGLFLALAGALLGGRLLHVILNFADFGFNLLKFILINGYPGLNFYGGLFGGLVVLYLFFLSKKIKFQQVADYFIGPIFIALGFGWLGNFFSQTPVELTFFYRAILFFAGFILGQKLLFDIRREKYPSGFLFYFFAWFTAGVNFLFDKLKINGLYWKGLTLDGLISGLIFLATSFYFIYYFRKTIIAYAKNSYQKIYQRARELFRKRVGKGKKTD